MIVPLWPSSAASMLTTFVLMLHLTPLIETSQTFPDFQTPKLHSAHAPFARKVNSSNKDVDGDTFNKFPQVSEMFTINTLFRTSSSWKKENVHDNKQSHTRFSRRELRESKANLSGRAQNRNIPYPKHNVPGPPKYFSPYHFILRRDTRLSSATHFLGINSRNHTATVALSSTFHHVDNTANDRDVVSGRLYRHGSPARLTRGGNIIVRESDIAAIFRGVAYGMPTESALMHRPMDTTTPSGSIGVSTTAVMTTDDPTPRVRVRLKLPEGHSGPEFQFSEGDVKFATVESEVGFLPGVLYPIMGFPTTIKLLIPPTYEIETVNGSDASTYIPESSWKRFENDGSDRKYSKPSTSIPDSNDLVSVNSLDDKGISMRSNENMNNNQQSSTLVPYIITSSISNDLLNVTRPFVKDNSSAQNRNLGFLFRYSWKNLLEYIDENIQAIWRIHVYLVTSVFLMISLVCCYRLVCHCRGALPFFLHVSFYLVMFASSFVRALTVLWNPYKGHGMLPEPVLNVLYIAGEPSVGVVMSSFIVLLLNIFYGMIALPVIIAFFSAAEMVTGVFLEFALGYFTIHVGDFSQNYLNTFSFIVGLSWNSIICIAYIILLSGKRFRQPSRGYMGGRKDDKGGSAGSDFRHRSDSVTDNCSYVSCYCLIATFAQLFMIGLYVYIVLHPDELISRPKHLKFKWVLFQIVGRILEVLVYTLLLISVSKISKRVYKGRSVSRNPKRKYCCFCCFVRNDGNRSKRQGKGTGNIYSLNVDYDAVNHCPTDDFQLVWSRNANLKSVSKDEAPCSSKRQCSCRPKLSKMDQSTKTKKLKTVRERNEKLQIGLHRNVDVERVSDSKETTRAKKSIPIKQKDGGIIFQENDEPHNQRSHDYSKYQSVRGKMDLQNILQIELPAVDSSMYKYMGVTLPHAMEYGYKHSISVQTKSRSGKTSETLPSPVKELSQEVEDCAKRTRRIPKQFWSPQHKPSKSFRSLPPLPLKAQAPINLPSLPPLNLKPVPPLNLPPLKLGQVSEKSATVGLDDHSLENLKRDQSFPEAFSASNYAYVPSKEFIKDFMGCHPSPFSDRLSSADLGTVSSYSEMRVDYLTDLSSADGNSIGSLSYYRSSRMSFSNISDNINYY